MSSGKILKLVIYYTVLLGKAGLSQQPHLFRLRESLLIASTSLLCFFSTQVLFLLSPARNDALVF